MTATPGNGTAPLLVVFGASVSTGVPGSANWSFGDGTYLNASGPGGLAPEHSYPAPGTYHVGVVVWEGTTPQYGTTTVVVRPAPVRVAVVATPLSGTVPLRVMFGATVSGGSGPEGAVNWSFGDGAFATGANVTHVFTSAGLYLVLARSSDANGSAGNASLFVDVTANSTGTLGGLPADVVTYGIAASVAVLVIAGLLMVRRGRRPVSPPPAGIYGGFEDAEALTPFEAPDSGVAGPTSTSGSGPAPTGGGPNVSVGPTDRGTPADPAAGPPPAASRSDPRRVTEAVIDFLYRLGRISPDDIPSTEWTQRGMGDQLGIPQNTLTNVLRRLEAAGIVTTRVEHVHGRPRRVKTYYLTPAGERLARSRRRGPRSGAVGGTPGRP